MFWPKKKVDFDSLLQRHIDGDFALFACGKVAPTESVIKEFEKTIGYSLPVIFREFSKSPLGGLYIEVKEEVWPRAKAYEVGPFWSFLYGVMVFGFANNIPEWLDIQKVSEEFQRESQSRYTPFMKVIGDANVYCFDHTQKIYRWDHETGEFEHIDKDFYDLLDYEISELKKRKEMKKQALS